MTTKTYSETIFQIRSGGLDRKGHIPGRRQNPEDQLTSVQQYNKQQKSTQASKPRDFHGEKILLYCCSDLQILMYLLKAIKPIVTGEM